MGACFSSAVPHPQPPLNSESCVVTASPVGEKRAAPDQVISCPLPEEFVTADKCRLSSAEFQSFGTWTTSDVFFDAQPCLESDSEDEFTSANGDLTPSMTPYLSRSLNFRNPSASPSHSPETERRVECRFVRTPALGIKSLSELFLESDDERKKDTRNDLSKDKIDEDTEDFMSIASASDSANSTPSVLGIHSSSHHSNARSTRKNSEKHRSSKSAHCLPDIFLMYSPKAKSPNKKTHFEA